MHSHPDDGGHTREEPPAHRMGPSPPFWEGRTPQRHGRVGASGWGRPGPAERGCTPGLERPGQSPPTPSPELLRKAELLVKETHPSDSRPAGSSSLGDPREGRARVGQGLPGPHPHSSRGQAAIAYPALPDVWGQSWLVEMWTRSTAETRR